jgi:hypothetical protein
MHTAFLRGRWPNLRSLLIGDVVLDWHMGLNPSLGKPFRTFFEERTVT